MVSFRITTPPCVTFDPHLRLLCLCVYDDVQEQVRTQILDRESQLYKVHQQPIHIQKVVPFCRRSFSFPNFKLAMRSLPMPKATSICVPISVASLHSYLINDCYCCAMCCSRFHSQTATENSNWQCNHIPRQQLPAYVYQFLFHHSFILDK